MRRLLVLLAAAAALLAWLTSGRSRVTFAPESGRVEVATQRHWLMRWSRRELAIREIVDAQVASLPGVKGGPVHMPALALRGGEQVVLGETGLRSPARAAYFAGELRRLLQLGDEPPDAPTR